MKKRIFAILLSALLVANISACNFVSKNEIEETFENVDITEFNFEETDGKITESKTNDEIEPIWEGCIPCNGVFRNSKVTYTLNENSGLFIHIPDWDEDHLVTSFSAKDIAMFRYSEKAIGINNERAFLLLKRFYASINQITVVSFEKGSQSEMVVNLDIDEDVYMISGNFINENTGFLFAFKEELGGHRGSSKLSNLFKTEDGGKTWNSINVQNAPSISRSEEVIFAKMITEDVGIISGGQGAADYNFCERTLLTTDGGLHWVKITALPQIDCLEGSVEIADFTLVEESYILTISQRKSENYNYVKYKSLDLNTWVRIS